MWISRLARSIVLSASSLATASMRRFTTSASRRPSSTMAVASAREAASFCSYSLSRASAASRSFFADCRASRMKLSRDWSVLRIGPQANLPRTNNTIPKITSVQAELPRSPANRLGDSPPSSAAATSAGIPSASRGDSSSALFSTLFIRASERGQQAHDDAEQGGALDHCRGDDHGGADLAGGLRLARHRLDRAAAHATDTGAGADDGEPGADRATDLAGAVGGEEVGVLSSVRTRGPGGRL